MNSSDEKKFRGLSPLAQLKEKWRALGETERDYWRKQFVSSRTILRLRQEISFKLRVPLISDVELLRFSEWVAQEDHREAEAERIAEAEAELVRALALEFSPPHSDDQPITPPLAAVRWLYRRSLLDLQRHAARAFLCPKDRRSFLRHAQKKLDQFHWDVVCLCALAWLEQPASLNNRN